MPYTWPPTAVEVSAELNLGTDTSEDSELAGFTAAAVGVIENIVGPVNDTTYTEIHDGGRPVIVLRRYPVLTVTSVTEYSSGTAQALAAEPLGTSPYTGYGYQVDLETGVLTRTDSGVPRPFAFGTGNVQVTYHAGQETVPAPVRLAALELIRHMWETQRGDSAGRPVPGYDTEPNQPFAGFLVPNRVAELLEPYRKAPKVA